MSTLRTFGGMGLMRNPSANTSTHYWPPSSLAAYGGPTRLVNGPRRSASIAKFAVSEKLRDPLLTLAEVQERIILRFNVRIGIATLGQWVTARTKGYTWSRIPGADRLALKRRSNTRRRRFSRTASGAMRPTGGYF